MSGISTFAATVENVAEENVVVKCLESNKSTVKLEITYNNSGLSYKPECFYFNVNWDEDGKIPAENVKIINNAGIDDTFNINALGTDTRSRADVFLYQEPNLPESFTIEISCDSNPEYETLYIANMTPGPNEELPSSILDEYHTETYYALSSPIKVDLPVADPATITADTSSIGEVYEGKSFTVPVKITDNPGFTACILEADYDKEALELTSITNGDVATSLAANDIVTGTANITSDSSITKESGTLFNYTFKVKEGAAPGDYDITMKYRNDDTGNFCNGDDDVPATFVKGTVKVVEKPEVIPADSQTTVWLSTDTATVNPDGTFNVDVFMKSDQLLASGQVDLAYNPAVATIQSITVNSPQGVNNGESNYDNEAGAAKISFYGDNLNASADAGLKVATVQMNALAEGSSNVKITSAEAAPKGSDGANLDQEVTISEEAAEVTVEVVEPSGFRVIPYVNGHRYLVMYEPSVAITEGVPTYLGEDMFWSEQYSFEANGTKGVWVCLTDKDVSLELKESDFGRNAEGTKSTVCYPASAVQGYLAGDVSGNGKVNIIDAQAAYDLSNRVYSTYDPIDMLHWLMADVNGNSLLEASDAQAIQYYLHYNTFALPAEG